MEKAQDQLSTAAGKLTQVTPDAAAAKAEHETTNAVGGGERKPFYSLSKFITSKFGASYAKSTIISRYLYTYALTSINSVNAKNGAIDIEDVENINRGGSRIFNSSSTEDET